MDVLSGTIDRSEVVYPMPKISLLSDEVSGALGKVKRDSNLDSHQME